MSHDPQQVPATPQGEPEKRPTREQDKALAVSIPDPNTIVLRLIKLLLRIKGPMSFVGTTGGVLSTLLVIVAIVGVPAMLAGASLIDKFIELRRDERSSRVEEAKARASVASDAVLTEIKGIGGKLDQQGKRIDQISRDVGALKSAQATTDRKVRTLQDEQQKRAAQGQQQRK